MSSFRSGQNRAVNQEVGKTAQPYEFHFSNVGTTETVRSPEMPKDGMLEHLLIRVKGAPVNVKVSVSLIRGGNAILSSEDVGSVYEFGEVEVKKGDYIICEVLGVEAMIVEGIFINYVLVA